MTGRAEFPYLMFLIYGTNCVNLEYVLAEAGRCEEAELSYSVAPGAEVWLWHGTAIFQGVPESRYVFTVCGIQDDPVPIRQTSWGQIKQRFGLAR
jgi:hypothetical protein